MLNKKIPHDTLNQILQGGWDKKGDQQNGYTEKGRTP